MNREKQILEELGNNRGCLERFKIPFSDYIYTSGINDLINKCGCYWLISDTGILLSHKPKLQRDFLILSIKVNEDKTAIITLKEDTGLKPIHTQKLSYSDFPLKEYEFYIINKVFLLKDEY